MPNTTLARYIAVLATCLSRSVHPVAHLGFLCWSRRRRLGLVVHRAMRLEALPVDDGRSRLVVLLLRDPHLLEGREGGENGTTDPDGVLALWGSDDLDLHAGRSKSSDLLLHTVADTGVHGGTTRLFRMLVFE